MEALQATFTLPDFGRWLPSMVALAQQTPIRPSALKPIHAALIAPFLSGLAIGAGTDAVRTQVTAVGSPEEAIAARMLAYGYCSHYFSGTDVPQLPQEPSSPAFQQYTLVASCAIGHAPLLLATLQVIVGDTVPALTLFEPVQGAALPHMAERNGRSVPGVIGELRRFSVNPLLEVKPALPDDLLHSILRNYRRLLYCKLYERSLQIFDAMRTHFVYGIATPEIYRFFTRSSMIMRPLASMRLAENTEVRALQTAFAGYWRPHAPPEHQPALYRIHLPADQRATHSFEP